MAMTGARNTNVNVKIGGLWKRSQNLSKLTTPNYKHRVFILTNHSLCYYKGTIDSVSTLKGRIEISSIKAIEYVDEGAFTIAHMFQIVYYTRKHGFVPLYVIARDDQECHEWVGDLRKVCRNNRETLLHYHPGAYRGFIWSCCRRKQRSAMGCHPTYSLLMRGQGSYSELKSRVSSTSVDRISHKSTDAKGIPKSTSTVAMSKTSAQHKPRTRRRSAEGGATMSTSFVDMTAIMSEKVDANLSVPKAYHSTGEISDSCITLPVERMEGVRETEAVKEGHQSHLHVTNHAARYGSHSPQFPHPHNPPRTHFSSSLSIPSPKHSRIPIAPSSHLSIQRNSSTSSSTGSNGSPALRKVSYSVQIMSPTPVPEEEVTHLSTRRREMELMTHTISPTHQSSMSQPDSQLSPTPQFKIKKSHDVSKPVREDQSITGLYLQPQMYPLGWGTQTQHIPMTVPMVTSPVPPVTRPQINPRVSDTHPCIIHL